MTISAETRRKIDINLDNLASAGGLITPDQNDKFYVDFVQSAPFLQSIRTFQMNSNKMRVPAFGINGRALHAAKQTGDRKLAADKRVDSNFRSPEINAKEFMAEAFIPYEAFENVVEGESFMDTFLAELNNEIAFDIQLAILQSDTALAGVDDDLAQFDGVLKLVNSNISDAAGAGISEEVLTNGFLALPERFRERREKLGFFTSSAQETRYSSFNAKRQTALGDKSITGNDVKFAQGIKVVPVGGIPEDTVLVMDPTKVAWGLQRNVRIETERLIGTREIHIVATLVMGCTVIDEASCAKITNLG